MHEQSAEEQQDWSSIVAWDEAERLAAEFERAATVAEEVASGTAQRKAGGSWRA